MTVRLLVDWKNPADSKQYLVNNLLTTDAGTETGLVNAKLASSDLTGGTAWVAPPVVESVDEVYPLSLFKDSNGNTVPIGADGAGVLKGPMISGTWFSSPSVFRLRITGTGTVQLDSRDSAGTVTAVETYTVSGATDQIEFPYAGDNAVAIRATFAGNITVEVL